jgi:hypothetical protein
MSTVRHPFTVRRRLRVVFVFLALILGTMSPGAPVPTVQAIQPSVTIYYYSEAAHLHYVGSFFRDCQGFETRSGIATQYYVTYTEPCPPPA